MLCRRHYRCHFERAEGPAKASRGEHSPLRIEPAVGRLFFNRFLHFAPVLSCESKNGGFGRNDLFAMPSIASNRNRSSFCSSGTGFSFHRQKKCPLWGRRTPLIPCNRKKELLQSACMSLTTSIKSKSCFIVMNLYCCTLRI